MISDSITNASATASSSDARDFSKKKKKNNKSAKVKQSKLGLHREQWLSQVAVTNKEERREKPDHKGGNRFMESPSSSSMGGTDTSSSITDDDDGCVDDWEDLADALEAKEEREKLLHESVKEVKQSASSACGSISDASESAEKDCLRMPSRSKRAWSPEDDHRLRRPPKVLPNNTAKQLDKRFTTTASSTPSSCPICCEDLDVTDSSFFPCPCGFRLCLFCHKTIYDGDGRCPGCRKPYERDAVTTETSFEGGCVTVRLTRSSIPCFAGLREPITLGTLSLSGSF